MDCNERFAVLKISNRKGLHTLQRFCEGHTMKLWLEAKPNGWRAFLKNRVMFFLFLRKKTILPSASLDYVQLRYFLSTILITSVLHQHEWLMKMTPSVWGKVSSREDLTQLQG
jgi:hypothetical protein